MFIKEFPVNCGTKVKTRDGSIGSIACYQCVSDKEAKGDENEFIVMVSGIKESWCGEYLLSELEILEE